MERIKLITMSKTYHFVRFGDSFVGLLVALLLLSFFLNYSERANFFFSKEGEVGEG